ncbi:RNI-like protein [Rhizoclosmatium globosum]|uniref:RNI-like protein n=1 Tax=Rhizoclosmatium globosum TaxID=329046 RepID=A0A1Y2C7Z3_9FUNG|nr:RNI-like protein [Rhizoclosmatium globosum]|eukprot:ORY43066.1 RNI-like protein [Rhizoclosmatium globosum]
MAESPLQSETVAFLITRHLNAQDLFSLCTVLRVLRPLVAAAARVAQLSMAQRESAEQQPATRRRQQQHRPVWRSLRITSSDVFEAVLREAVHELLVLEARAGFDALLELVGPVSVAEFGPRVSWRTRVSVTIDGDSLASPQSVDGIARVWTPRTPNLRELTLCDALLGDANCAIILDILFDTASTPRTSVAPPQLPQPSNHQQQTSNVYCPQCNAPIPSFSNINYRPQRNQYQQFQPAQRPPLQQQQQLYKQHPQIQYQTYFQNQTSQLRPAPQLQYLNQHRPEQPNQAYSQQQSFQNAPIYTYRGNGNVRNNQQSNQHTNQRCRICNFTLPPTRHNPRPIYFQHQSESASLPQSRPESRPPSAEILNNSSDSASSLSCLIQQSSLSSLIDSNVSVSHRRPKWHFLETLILNENLLSDSTLQLIASNVIPICHALSVLELKGNQFTIAGKILLWIGVVVCLKHLILSWSGIQSLASHLPATNIKHLNLSSANMTDATLLPLSQSLSLTSLQTLLLMDNKLTHIGMQSFSRALRETPRLKHLDLSANQGIADLGTQCIVSALIGGSRLETLCLERCNIGYKAVSPLSKILVRSSIRVLKVSENPRIGPPGLTLLGHALAGSPVEEFYAASVTGKDMGCKAIVEGLLRNSRLKVLDLRDNQITNDGAVALASVLGIAKLERLILDENAIMDRGVETLANCIAGSMIVELGLEGNKVEELGENALKKAYAQVKKSRYIKIKY